MTTWVSQEPQIAQLTEIETNLEEVGEPDTVEPVPLAKFPTGLFANLPLSFLLDFSGVGHPECSEAELMFPLLGKLFEIFLLTYSRLLCSPIVSIYLTKTIELFNCLPLP